MCSIFFGGVVLTNISFGLEESKMRYQRTSINFIYGRYNSIVFMGFICTNRHHVNGGPTLYRGLKDLLSFAWVTWPGWFCLPHPGARRREFVEWLSTEDSMVMKCDYFGIAKTNHLITINGWDSNHQTWVVYYCYTPTLHYMRYFLFRAVWNFVGNY